MPQRGHWETRYGSRTSLRNMVDNAHQNDIKIYPDIVFNHTGNGPDYRTYPGMHPQDFHITLDGSQPGGYRRPPRMFEWDANNGTGGTLHQELVSLMDLVLEFDNRFQTGGFASQGYAADPTPFIRHPGDYDKYPYNPSGTLPSENSRQFNVRWINWLGYAMDYDGVRLDAPKHVYKDFFGLPNDTTNRDQSFIYNIQKNFNERRGLSDSNPFDDMYANDLRRDDAMVYSEFFIGSVGEVDYWRNPSDRGWGIQTRYLDFPRKKGMMSDAFNNGNLGALAAFTGFDPTEGVMFAHSHDEGPPGKLELAYAYILTRVGVPVVYFSGNNLKQSEIGRAPGKNTWMEKGYDYALGDTVNNYQTGAIPNLIYIHNQFCRGREYTRWTENDFFAYERYDDLNSNSNPNAGEGLILVALNDSGNSQTRGGIQTSFAPGTVLKDYSGNNLNTVTVDGSSQVSITVPPRGGQGWVCYAPFNADVQPSVDPLQFSGTVSDMAWIIPGGRDGVAKPRTLRRISGNSVTIDVRFAQPAQGGETVDNVLVKWGQGRNLNASATDFTGKDVVTGGFEQTTQIAPGHWRLVADLTNVPEGLHNIKARIFNGRAAGKPALFQTFSETVYVDRAGPDLAFENLNDGETIQGARVVTVNNPDRTIYNLTYSIDGGAQQQADMVIKGKWRINLDGLPAGAHSITLNASEADYGNPRSVIGTSSLTRGFTMDSAGPAIAMNHANGATISEPFFKTVVTVPNGQGVTASDIKLYWNGYEQPALVDAGGGNFESTFDGRYISGGVQRQFTGAFVNGPHFFEAVVTKDGQENRVSRKVVYNLYGQNMHDSDGDGIPDEVELSGFLNGTNPGPDQRWPGDNSYDLIPNYGENWTRLNAMSADTDYAQRPGAAGSWDGDEDWDGDGVSNLQEVIRGYRLTGDPYRYNIYDGNSTPPASMASAASAVLGMVGGVKTVTVSYNPNDGSLNGVSPIRVRMTPTGGGSEQFFTMTAADSNTFSYAYSVPSGVTSVAYSFSNADDSLNDTSGSGWSIATPPVASSATATLGAAGASKTLTVVYTATEGPLAGLTPVNITLTPTGAGSSSTVAMTSLGNGVFSYTYTVPSGASSVSYTFASGATNDTTGSSGWVASTSSGFNMDGEFDSPSFVVADNGMRIYAAVRGTKLYVATWSTKGGVNDHFLFITDQFGNPQAHPWAKAGQIYFNSATKPWIGANPTDAYPSNFGASGRNWLGDAGKALETEIDLIEVFGQVPKTVYIAAASYGRLNGSSLLSQAPASFGDDSNSIEIPEFQAVNPASIRDENLDGVFDVGTPYMATVVGDNEADANYGLRRFYLDEILKDSASITVKFKPNTGAGDLVSNAEVFTNLNRRDFAVLEEDPSTVATTSTDTYFKAYAMSGPDGDGYYTATLPVNRCGAYRLQVRYKVNGGAYTYYTDHAQRRDCAIVVSPKKALKSNMYEVNPLVVEAKDTTFAGRSTFLDLVNDPALPGESGGYDGRPDALNKDHYAGVGMNMLWLQPIHPIGIDGRDTNPETPGQPFDPGSPYAVRDYWSVAPMLGRDNTAGTALAEFQTFVSRLDSWGVGVMMDGTFNHSSPDAIMGQGAADLGLPYSPNVEIRNANHAWFAKEGYPGLPAGSIGEIAIAPDRNDFGNWTDVREFYFGSYDTLVKAKGTYDAINKTYPDNANRKEYLLERDEFEGHTAQTREVWEYFAYYPVYWLEKSGHPRGTPKEQSYKGIDGLRCDFAQGLPSQFWEYAINKTRSVKWDFLFMAESLDGYREVNGSKRHGVGYRSARHFDILNENIVFYWRDQFFGYPANGGAGTPATPSTGATFNAYDNRRDAFDNVTLLNNLVSHDEVFPHNDVFSLAYAYSQVAAIDGTPMLFYGQEAGAQNSKTAYAASEGNFGTIDTARNFAKYESNFGKNIPNFKVYNNMLNIWNSGTRDWAVQTFYGRINNTRKSSPALQSQNVYFLNKKASGGGFNNGVFAVGKVQQPGLSAGQQDVMFVFVNNNYRATSSIADTFDLNALAPSGSANYFGIERGKSYNVKDLVSDSPTAYVWEQARTGADILDNGLYVGLPYNGKHAHYLKLVDQTEGAYPDLDGDGLYDQTDADMDGDGLTNAYEEANGMNARSAAGADGRDADNDGDGYSNYVEYVAGTKANDASSALRVVDIVKGATEMNVAWKSVPGAVYRVRYSYNLSNGWSDVEGGLISADSAQTEVTMSVPNGTEKAFYTVSLVP